VRASSRGAIRPDERLSDSGGLVAESPLSSGLVLLKTSGIHVPRTKGIFVSIALTGFVAIVLAAQSSWPPALSILKPKGTGCEWSVKSSASSDGKVLATFPGACESVRVWLTPSGKKALCSSVPAGAKTGAAQLEEIDLPSGKKRAIPPVPRGEVDVLGVDAQGKWVLLTLESPIDPDKKDIKLVKNTIHLGAKTYSVCDTDLCVGSPMMAHGFRLRGKTWEKVESVAFMADIEGSIGSRNLELRREVLGSKLEGAPCGPMPFDRVRDPRVLAVLTKWEPPHKRGSGWLYVSPDKAMVSLAADGKGRAATMPLLFLDGKSAMPLSNLPQDGIEHIELTCAGGLTLGVFRAKDDKVLAQRVYDRKTQKEVAAWTEGLVQLWPRAAESKPAASAEVEDPMDATFDPAEY
jgi:hypothetical protein